MGAVLHQIKFAWNHLGRFRQAILLVCAAMTKVNDLLGWLPESVRTKIGWLVPQWPWYWWVILLLLMVVAFVVEGSYSQQHTEGAKKNALPVVVIAGIGLAWVASIGVTAVSKRTVEASRNATRPVPQNAPLPSNTSKESSPSFEVSSAENLPSPSPKPIKRDHIKPRGPQSGPATTRTGPPSPVTLNNSPGSAVSVNQQGGITAGQINIGVHEWEPMLAGDKQVTLIDALAQAQGKFRIECLFQDIDGQKMAGFLNFAFTQAKWTPDQPANYAGSICYPQQPSDCSGLRVTVKDRTSQIAQLAIGALSAFVPGKDVHVTESDSAPEDRVEILVTRAP
jgi:hypothetical protein